MNRDALARFQRRPPDEDDSFLALFNTRAVEAIIDAAVEAHPDRNRILDALDAAVVVVEPNCVSVWAGRDELVTMPPAAILSDLALMMREPNWMAVLERRSATTVAGRVVHGLAVPYGQVADIRADDRSGRVIYRERFARGAFNDVLAAGPHPPPPVMVVHDRRKLSVGTVQRFIHRPEGLFVEMRFSETAFADDILTLIRDQALTGLSIRFSTPGSDDDFWFDDAGLMVFERGRGATIQEVSVTPLPTYDAARVVHAGNVPGRQQPTGTTLLRSYDRPGDKPLEHPQLEAIRQQARAKVAAHAAAGTLDQLYAEHDAAMQQQIQTRLHQAVRNVKRVNASRDVEPEPPRLPGDEEAAQRRTAETLYGRYSRYSDTQRRYLAANPRCYRCGDDAIHADLDALFDVRGHDRRNFLTSHCQPCHDRFIRRQRRRTLQAS